MVKTVVFYKTCNFIKSVSIRVGKCVKRCITCDIVDIPLLLFGGLLVFSLAFLKPETGIFLSDNLLL